jgi:CBS domain-containing protein
MKVFEICKRTVACVGRSESLVEAARKMREAHVGDLVVVEDRDNLRVPVAMLTDRDIVVGVIANNYTELDKLDVGDVVGDVIVTATEDEDVGDVLRRMRSFAVRRVPVVDASGALKGIVALDDVLAGLADELAEAASLTMRQRIREAERRP